MDLLRDLVRAIQRDYHARAKRKTKLIFLGDLIDRGPSSKEVLGFARSVQLTHDVTFLMGNHEAALLASLDGDEHSQHLWLEHGGLATLRSFDIAPPQAGESAEHFGRRLSDSIPADTIVWIRQMPLFARSGSYFFCHAGVRPGTPLAEQAEDDLLWIRKDFINSTSSHGAIIVHGHTICGDEVEILQNRINVDTGAYESGILSAIGLEDVDHWVLATPGSVLDD
jgi:serine/threonine protein phosphatase 1